MSERMTWRGRATSERLMTLPRGWRWLPGARARYGEEYDPSMAWRCIHAEDEDGAAEFVSDEGDVFSLSSVGAPWQLALCTIDVGDPATLGCMTALCRDAYGDSTFHAAIYAKKWRVYWRGTWVSAAMACRTEGEALWRALDVAAGVRNDPPQAGEDGSDDEAAAR